MHPLFSGAAEAFPVPVYMPVAASTGNLCRRVIDTRADSNIKLIEFSALFELIGRKNFGFPGKLNTEITDSKQGDTARQLSTIAS